MKKFINRSFVLCLFFGIFSCSDLQEEPIGLLAPEAFFKTATDVETSVLGAYAYIASEQFYGRKLVLSLQLRSDMCDIGDRNTPGRRQQVNDFNMDTNNGMITAFWPRAYQIIGAANAGISGAELVGEPAEQINALKAEAMFIRAFTYYHLVRIFGDIPYIDFFITDPEEIKEISKTPADQVYQLIIADLEFAKQNLPDDYAGSLRSRPTRGTAAAYLASVHLTMGNNQQAYDEAKFVIDNKARFGYDLMPDFQELFDGSNADGLAEHVFMVDFLGQVVGSNSQQNDWMGPITGIRSVSLPNTNAGWSVSVPAFSVFETWDARDYRRKVSFIDSAYIDDVLVGYDQFAPNHGSPRPHQGKYFRMAGNHRGDSGISDNNYSAFRYAEVLLIAAEAANNLGGRDAEVIGYINEIRARARNWAGTQVSFPEDVTAGGDLTQIIRDERRLELAFEFKRWYDIKRWNIGDEVFKGANAFELHDNFDASRDYFFPLPQDELDRNANLKPQNPGY
ncbi:MAG: RagB/SusD family nutrient uptake outer membrane protein [Flammeovirgaceae bacterium]|nr:RagB/SusD family nutrient uptake outer membrane protein [Flammeovirgaceae bacterium]